MFFHLGKKSCVFSEDYLWGAKRDKILISEIRLLAIILHDTALKESEHGIADENHYSQWLLPTWHLVQVSITHPAVSYAVVSYFISLKLALRGFLCFILFWFLFFLFLFLQQMQFNSELNNSSGKILFVWLTHKSTQYMLRDHWKSYICINFNKWPSKLQFSWICPRANNDFLFFQPKTFYDSMIFSPK